MDLFHKKELASLKSELTRLKGLIPDEALDKADFLLSLDDKIAQNFQSLMKQLLSENVRNSNSILH